MTCALEGCGRRTAPLRFLGAPQGRVVRRRLVLLDRLRRGRPRASASKPRSSRWSPTARVQRASRLGALLRASALDLRRHARGGACGCRPRPACASARSCARWARSHASTCCARWPPSPASATSPSLDPGTIHHGPGAPVARRGARPRRRARRCRRRAAPLARWRAPRPCRACARHPARAHRRDGRAPLGRRRPAGGAARAAMGRRPTGRSVPVTRDAIGRGGQPAHRRRRRARPASATHAAGCAARRTCGCASRATDGRDRRIDAARSTRHAASGGSAYGRRTYVALSGMRTRLDQLDRLAADIANAGTAGYKTERVGAPRRPSGPTFDAGPADSAIDVVARRQGMIDFRTGSIESTGRDSTSPLEGRGFFVVDTPAGRATRATASSRRSADGTLMTADGDAVQGDEGPITLADGTRQLSKRTARSRAGGAVAGKLAIVDFGDYMTPAPRRRRRFRAGDGNADARCRRPRPCVTAARSSSRTSRWSSAWRS